MMESPLANGEKSESAQLDSQCKGATKTDQNFPPPNNMGTSKRRSSVQNSRKGEQMDGSKACAALEMITVFRGKMRLIMKIICVFLVLLVASCASEKPTIEPSKHVETPPPACELLVSAINRGDWLALKPWTKPGTASNTIVQAWQTAAKAGNPVKVGKFLNAQTVGGSSKKPYKLYSYALENKDGTVNPHWLQIKVRESDGAAEIVDFWNFGW